MPLTGKFVHLDATTLATLKTKYVAAAEAIADGNQSYSIGGRSFTRANLAEVTDTLAEIAYAQAIQATDPRLTYADLSHGP